MNMKKINLKKMALGVLSIGTIGLIATSGAVSAFQGDPTNQGPNYDADLHDLKVDAFNSNDYEVWKDLMEEVGVSGRVLEVVNEDNFNTFVMAHNASLEGDMELAKELRASIGLNDGVGLKDGAGYKQGGAGQGMAEGQGMKESRQGLNTVNFVDADADGTCDNTGLSTGTQKGQGRR